MKVILLQDVKTLGKKNQVIEVSDGYAQNYLIPKRLAVKFTEKGLEVRDKQIADEKALFEKNQAEARVIADRLKDITLEFTAPASKDGRMMGTISPKQALDKLKTEYGIELDKRKFVDKYPCNSFGYTRLKIQIFKGVEGVINVHVTEKK